MLPTTIILANAQSPDLSSTSLATILSYLAIVIATGLAAIPPLVLACRHPRSDLILGFTLLWAILTAGSLLWFVYLRTQWSAEYQRLIMSGYYDPQNPSPAPAPPWVLWTPLLIAYPLLLLYALKRPKATP